LKGRPKEAAVNTKVSTSANERKALGMIQSS